MVFVESAMPACYNFLMKPAGAEIKEQLNETHFRFRKRKNDMGQSI